MATSTSDETKTWYTCHGFVERGDKQIAVHYGAPGYEGAAWSASDMYTPSRFSDLESAIREITREPSWDNGNGVPWSEVKNKFLRKHTRRVQQTVDYEVEDLPG